MNLLIPYVQSTHLDPALNEYTYGDVGQRGRKLRLGLKQGDYVFFHTNNHGKKYITAYYVVDRVLETAEACRNHAIRAKYKNPHISEHLERKGATHNVEDAIVFGDPITSRVLERPLPFDRGLAEKLSLNIRFPVEQSATQSIGSSTRAWRELTNGDVRILLREIAREQRRPRQNPLRSTEEVAETLERDIEYHIAQNPNLIGRGLKLSRQQKFVGAGRLDVLLEDKDGNWTVVEVKLGHIGREALQQIRTYIHDLREEITGNISGVIVCAGVLPAFESEIGKQREIKILTYGWGLRVEPWQIIETKRI